VPNFVIQGGDPRGDGEGGPGYQIRCEVNPRPYIRGAVGMALSGKDTGGSQFFITHSPQPHLDGGYTVFGQVISGMEVVDRITRGDVIRKVEIFESRGSHSSNNCPPIDYFCALKRQAIRNYRRKRAFFAMIRRIAET